MTFNNALLSSVLTAQREGQSQYDRRTRRGALSLYFKDPEASERNALLPAAPATTEALVGGPPIEGGALAPALPAGSPRAEPGGPRPSGTPTTYDNALRPSPISNRSAAMRVLGSIGDFETASQLTGFDDRQRSDAARDRIAPMIQSGHYRDAAREAGASGQMDLARQLFAMDDAELATTQRRGQQGASAIYAALALPPQQRADYMAQHQGLAADAGITPEQFASFDWSNDAALKATADRWLEASRLAGDVSLQKFGDNAYAVRASPRGLDVLPGGVAIPETRAEGLDRDRVAYQQSSDQRDFDYQKTRDAEDDRYRHSRAQSEDAYRRWQMENPNSRGDVEGQVLSKAVRQGAQTLTPEERAIYDRYLTSGSPGDVWGAPATPAAPRPQAAPPAAPAQRPSGTGTPGAPARPQTEEDYNRLPAGALFIDPDDGLTYRKGG